MLPGAGAHTPALCAQTSRALDLIQTALEGRSRVRYQELALLVQVSPPSEALSYVCVRTGANIGSPCAKNSPGGFCVHDSLGRRSSGVELAHRFGLNWVRGLLLYACLGQSNEHGCHLWALNLE